MPMPSYVDVSDLHRPSTSFALFSYPQIPLISALSLPEVPFMVRWLAERSKAGKESLYSLGVGEAEKLRNEIKQLQELRR